MDEEVIVLEEQLAAANVDIEMLQASLADAQALATTREDQRLVLRHELDGVRQALAERDEVLSGRDRQLDELTLHLQEAREQAALGATRYREAILAREPELPSDLVGGDTVDAIERSLAQARQTVAQVRQHLDQQAQAQRIPTGAPPRAAPDISALSPAEKIRLGLDQS